MDDMYTQLGTWTDLDLLDLSGDKIGTVDDLYYDEVTGQADWLLVKTGLFGLKKTFVPATEVRRESDHLVTTYTKDRVKDAPSVDDEELLTDEEERELYSYYGLGYKALGKRWSTYRTTGTV